jgi:hypothetical protein
MGWSKSIFSLLAGVFIVERNLTNSTNNLRIDKYRDKNSFCIYIFDLIVLCAQTNHFYQIYEAECPGVLPCKAWIRSSTCSHVSIGIQLLLKLERSPHLRTGAGSQQVTVMESNLSMCWLHLTRVGLEPAGCSCCSQTRWASGLQPASSLVVLLERSFSGKRILKDVVLLYLYVLVFPCSGWTTCRLRNQVTPELICKTTFNF